MKDIFAKIIREGITAGEFRKVDPDVAANVILAGLEGSSMLWVVDTENTPVEEMGEQMEEIFAGFLTRREA